MMNIGLTELLIILFILLLLFGAKRLPELASGLGKAIKEFKKGVSSKELDDKESSSQEGEKEEKKEGS